MIRVDSDAGISSNPKALPKESRATVVPMNEVVYPIMHDANDATMAERYTRQLYTAAGVGLSSIFASIPISAVERGTKRNRVRE